MRGGRLLALSIALNLVLWAALSLSRTPEVDLHARVITVEPAAPMRVEEASPQVTMNKVSRFTWAMLEPEDLRQYVTNLHAIECPDEVIDWIAVEYLRPKWLEGVDRVLAPVHARFFELAIEAKGDLLDLAKPQQEELEQWFKSCESELESVLGRAVTYHSPATGVNSRVKRHMDYLTEEEAAKAVKTYDSYAAGLRDSKKSFAEKQEISSKRALELIGLISPEAAEEFLLRESDHVWRVQSRVFADRPGELRAIVGLMESARARARSAEETDSLFMEGFKQALGEERWEDYKLAQDYEYRKLWELGLEDGFPKARLKAAYEVRKQAEAEIKLLQDAAEREPEQAVQLRQEWRVRTLDGLLKTLGPELAQRYFRKNNDWFNPNLSVRKRQR